MTTLAASEAATLSLPRGQGKTAGTSVAPASSRKFRFVHGNSVIEMESGIWRMQIRENGYYSGGFAIGRLLAAANYPAIRLFRTAYFTAFSAFLYAVMRRHFANVRIPKRYLEELQGYADGTGIPYRTLFTLNFIFDVAKKYGVHCSSIAVAGEESILVGRNTDLLPWIGKLALKWFPSVVLDVATPEKLRYVHVTPALFLGAFNGFNERGIAMMSHQVAATKEDAVTGNLATTLLQRMLLEEATDMAHAESITRANPTQRCIANMVVSNSESESCIFEISPTAVKTLPMNGRHQCCATHFQDAELSSLHRKTPEASQSRLGFMNRLAEKTQATPDGVIDFLKDHANGISHRGSGRSPTNEGTYQSLVFDIARHRIFVADGTTLPVSLSGAYREIAVDI